MSRTTCQDALFCRLFDGSLTLGIQDKNRNLPNRRNRLWNHDQFQKKLLDQVRDLLCPKHYPCGTEEPCANWVTRYVLSDDRRCANDMGASICLRV